MDPNNKVKRNSSSKQETNGKEFNSQMVPINNNNNGGVASAGASPLLTTRSSNKSPEYLMTSWELKSRMVPVNNNENGGVDGGGAASPIDAMTSREFQSDTHAHIDTLDSILSDKERFETFKEAILLNKHLFEGKTVLDVGCGIGILSLFAAKAGAAKVFAIDSSNVIYYTREVVKANDYENIIEVLKGEIEDINLPVENVDIIVSDWIGYSLLYQSKCRWVIYARDKWLKKSGGLIFPDQGKLFISAIEDDKFRNDHIDWWYGVHGFNMSCMRNVALKEPRIKYVAPENVLSKQYAIKLIDMYKATTEDLRFRSKYMLRIEKSGRMSGIVLYFHIYFTESHTPLGINTDPWSARTHWMQSVFFFDDTHPVKEKELYYGGIEFCPTEAAGMDLSEIIVNLEMLRGDPMWVDFEIQMSWLLKPITSKANPDARFAEEEEELIQELIEEELIESVEKLDLDPGSCDTLSNTVVLSSYTMGRPREAMEFLSLNYGHNGSQVEEEDKEEQPFWHHSKFEHGQDKETESPISARDPKKK